MFIKSIRTSADADRYLADTMNKFNNIYTGMNLDDQPSSLRIPIDLPDRLALNIENDSNIDFSQKSYKNCRPIMSSLIDGKVNIGMTNVQRASDGILREITPIMMYKDKYYPYLSLKQGPTILNKKCKRFCN